MSLSPPITSPSITPPPHESLWFLQFYFGMTDQAQLSGGRNLTVLFSFFFSSMETVFSPVSGPHTTIILLPWLQPFCLKASFCLVLFHPRFCLPLLVHRDNPCSEDDGWLTRVIEKRSKFRREKPSTHHLTAHMPAPSCLTSTRPCLVKTEEDFEGTPKKMCHYWGWRVTY